MQTRKDLERQSSQLVKVSNEKEQLAGEASHLSVQLLQTDRELKQTSDSNGALKSEKEQLESALYEAHQLLGTASASAFFTCISNSHTFHHISIF